jgi:hypothetical protein
MQWLSFFIFFHAEYSLHSVNKLSLIKTHTLQEEEEEEEEALHPSFYQAILPLKMLCKQATWSSTVRY